MSINIHVVCYMSYRFSRCRHWSWKEVTSKFICWFTNNLRSDLRLHCYKDRLRWKQDIGQLSSTCMYNNGVLLHKRLLILNSPIYMYKYNMWCVKTTDLLTLTCNFTLLIPADKRFHSQSSWLVETGAQLSIGLSISTSQCCCSMGLGLTTTGTWAR